jgi:protein-S-isoprenylcysteine O-methyltransferase Ste14
VTSGASGLTGAVWGLFEVGLVVRDRARGQGGTEHDARTRTLIRAALTVAIVVGAVAPGAVPSLAIPGRAWLTAAGVAVMWLGLLIRVWAVVTLGPAFRTTVEVDAGQPVVTSGPYRWVRHPAYTGIVLIVAGFGLAADNWVAAVACLLLPTLALLRRMRVEEDELTRVLGDGYEAYRVRTKRLIPGLW